MRPLLLSIILLTGCGSNNSEQVDYAVAADAAAPALSYAELADKPELQIADVAKPATQLLIYNGELLMQVENLPASRDSAMAILRKAGGYISGENRRQEDNRNMQTINMRIPAARFDAVMIEMERLAVRVEQRLVSTEDVTQEFTDNEARMRSRKATEEQYLVLLRRATKVSEMLEVQEQLGRIREEIEVVEGRQRYLRNQLQYSTLNLTLFELTDSPQQARPGFWSRLGDSIADGWDALQSLVLGLVAAWPFVLLIAVLVWLWRRLRPRWRWRKAVRENPAGV